ncbi:AAA domain-containing protein [Kutzneria sp. NPDC052558]|uniref:caspase, EACC1-associated type n=1 Tax=Kutzneria sp. NPDC052558 TaxID=3364121 RepID=UPI0037C660C2
MKGPQRRRALLIGTANYQCDSYDQLLCAETDVKQLFRALHDSRIGAFDRVEVRQDLTADRMRQEIADFLEDLAENELGLLYISGHGVRLAGLTGEFHFIAADTDDNVQRTGVDAGYVNERLEQCRAQQKVAILDCCHSGGFVRGHTTKGKAGQDPMLAPRDVYIMSSCLDDQESYAGAVTEDGPEPSKFTGALLKALHSSDADASGDGMVSAHDLFEQTRKLLKQTFKGLQLPVYSALNITEQIYIAHSFRGPLPRTSAIAVPAPTSSAPAPETMGTWPKLLEYYRRCIGAEATSLQLMGVTETGESYVCLDGEERLLSGNVDEDGSMPVPPEAAELVERAIEEESDLWCGYPAVVVTESPDGRRLPTHQFAPLFIRRVEVRVEGDELRLAPVGAPELHPQLRGGAPDDFRPMWRGGGHIEMVREINSALAKYAELPAMGNLDPGALEPVIDIRTPNSGARNSAVLFAVKDEKQAGAQIMTELDAIAGKATAIDRTALGALLGPLTGVDGRPWEPVTPMPLNEGQQAIIESAMDNRLTVATGPPGTGKSQLVANLVATAVANGQKVLVASTNNAAVNVVWERCEQLAPGSVVRTGSTRPVNYREEERNSLQQLATVTPPRTNASTAWAQLAMARADLDVVKKTMGHKAELERRLLGAGQRRQQAATDLGAVPGQLRAAFADVTDLGGRAVKAGRVAQARLFGTWRRRRFLKSLRWHQEPTPEVCAALAAWFGVEAEWVRERALAAQLPPDDTETQALARCQQAVQDASRQLLDTVVRHRATVGKAKILGLMNASASAKPDWPDVPPALVAVGGWAVTTRSIRRFPTQEALFDLVIIDEASQCTIPDVIPALFRAKRALIIGDAMQLAPVVTLKPALEAQIRREVGIAADWLETRRLTYHRHSSFHAFDSARGGSLLLDEHFRCHPDIAAIANRHFYGNQLTVFTDVRGLRRLPDRDAGVIWAQRPGRPVRGMRGSWVNHDEARRVLAVVAKLRADLPPGSDIGVVTPYAAQAALLKRHLRDQPDVLVGTVHTFQGGERDAMVFSLVASQDMPAGSRSWLNRQLNLWNVGITRAKSHLLVVGDQQLWQQERGLGGVLADAAEQAKDRQPGGPDDELSRLLFARLSGPSVTVELNTTVHGHRADAVVLGAEPTRAVLLDRGSPDAFPARHLRRQHVRTDLIGGVRLPAWRLFAEDVQPLP